jgi:hypothetical protein
MGGVVLLLFGVGEKREWGKKLTEISEVNNE